MIEADNVDAAEGGDNKSNKGKSKSKKEVAKSNKDKSKKEVAKPSKDKSKSNKDKSNKDKKVRSQSLRVRRRPAPLESKRWR